MLGFGAKYLEDRMKNFEYRKGRALSTALIYAGLVLTGWTLLLIVKGDGLVFPA